MKPGRRALGIAESYRGQSDTDVSSTLGGAVVTADRVVDDIVFGTIEVGGLDATEAIQKCWDRLDRPDVRFVFVSGIALAWYNLVDIRRLASMLDRPIIAISYEESPGLERALEEAFDGDALDRRLDLYGSLPSRREIETSNGPLFVRSVGLDEDKTTALVRAYSSNGRPEPLRVAKLAASAADSFRRN
ncbi:MAG: DUF99 family protein [Natronomonas sp.]